MTVGSGIATRGRVAAFALLAATMVVGTFTAGVSAAPRDAAGDGRRYIVTFRDSVADPHGVSAEHAARNGAEITAEYSHVLKGYAATFKGDGLGEVMRDPRVESVELDGEVSATVDQILPSNNNYWGLDRINQPNWPLDLKYSYTNTGAGVTAYIVDTGINYAHSEFGGRATLGTDVVPGNTGTGEDCNGHGSHVAGIVGGGILAGVAKGVTLKSVRVLDCSGSGSWSTIIQGLDWVAQDHIAKNTPAVANLSLGGGTSTAGDNAINSLISNGVTVVVAAGNGNFIGIAQDACKGSPSRVPAAITVSATDINDVKASFANYGSCVDWFAPGVNIASAYWQAGTTDPYKLASGTSMAAPFTAGVAALYLQINPNASPATVREALYAKTTANVVKQSKTNSPRLLFTDY